MPLAPRSVFSDRRARGVDVDSDAMAPVRLLVEADGEAAGCGYPVRELSDAGVRGHGSPDEGARRPGRPRLRPLRNDPLLGAAYPASCRQGAHGEERPRLLDRIRAYSQAGREPPARAAPLPADAHGVPSRPEPAAARGAGAGGQSLDAGAGPLGAARGHRRGHRTARRAGLYVRDQNPEPHAVPPGRPFPPQQEAQHRGVGGLSAQGAFAVGGGGKGPGLADRARRDHGGGRPQRGRRAVPARRAQILGDEAMAAVLRLADDQGRRRPAPRISLPQRLPVVPGLDEPPDRVPARLTSVRVSLSNFLFLTDILHPWAGRIQVLRVEGVTRAAPFLLFFFISTFSYFFMRCHIFRAYRVSFSVIGRPRAFLHGADSHEH